MARLLFPTQVIFVAPVRRRRRPPRGRSPHCRRSRPRAPSRFCSSSATPRLLRASGAPLQVVVVTFSPRLLLSVKPRSVFKGALFRTATEQKEQTRYFSKMMMILIPFLIIFLSVLRLCVLFVQCVCLVLLQS